MDAARPATGAGADAAFHKFAEDWWTRAKLQLAPKTRTDYMWRLERHLVPYFGPMPLDTMTYDTVESYIASKLAECGRIRESAARGEPLAEEITDALGRRRKQPLRPLSPRAINMTVTLLAAILEKAVERELIPGNTARGRDRRVKERNPARPHLDTAAQIEALLRAAGEHDREATRERQHLYRRAEIATMIFAGLGVGELRSLREREVDLPAGWLRVTERTGTKTDARVRNVKIRGALRDELLAVRARRSVDQNAFVFPTRTGRRQPEDKVRDMLGRAVRRANENLANAGLPPLPEGLATRTHSLRRTFCSLLYALGLDPGEVMDEIGHTHEGLALRVYHQARRRSEDEKAKLRALVEGGVWANTGERADSEAPKSVPGIDAGTSE